ncbi:leucine-rich repeat, immunoglobulin-like domain and transmembrane domain-containing protein 2 [Cylas formicarius]|uniref:leucine-rich repeat, immunoglobulin-like domain and transmembrane domain-containing protein 2 n=1 Tax=Cylas formicarius TaxID=197179 RepID=UPI002958C2F7|nr:leucine-rich repeat, immunoglobulin-like domain and transmembrane domain-containing protein 2 [Cylas formicarius]
MAFNNAIVILTMVVAVGAYTHNLSGTCPSLCMCKWKSGKQTVECVERGLITVPESADPETQVLDLSGNNLQILPRETFVRSGLVNLQRVFLSRCRIGQIDDKAFRGLTNLVELDLSHNLLTSVPSITFADTPFLRDLVLSNNPVQKIDSNAFQVLHALVKLDLSNCEIKMITPNAFEGIEMLESLKLNGNQLSELRPNTVEVLNKLHGIELHDNPWYCDCRLRVVKEWLTYNNIPYPIVPKCGGGPERLIDKSFAEIQMDDLACKPEILPVSRYVEVFSGENATVACRANAVPSPHIKWYWNGRLLVNNSQFSSHQKIHIFETGLQEKKSNLVLTNVQEIDSTEFYCVAENRAGNSEANYTLRVTSRPLGITSLGNGQIAGLSAALVVLILFILVVILILLMRLRRHPLVETKTPGQMEVITVVNGSNLPNGKVAISPSNATVEVPSFPERGQPTDLKFCNPVQKPPRVSDLPYSSNNNGMMSASCVSPSSNSGNNPDLINDTKQLGSEEMIPVAVAAEGYDMERPGSGEYSRNADSLYPSSLWNADNDLYSTQRMANNNPAFIFDDRVPIVDPKVGYPKDYGLPITEIAASATQVSLPTNTKTLRVWQKGGVPVLPPVTALKRALSSNRNSPDEGYQEGCGTDV